MRNIKIPNPSLAMILLNQADHSVQDAIGARIIRGKKGTKPYGCGLVKTFENHDFSNGFCCFESLRSTPSPPELREERGECLPRNYRIASLCPVHATPQGMAKMAIRGQRNATPLLVPSRMSSCILGTPIWPAAPDRRGSVRAWARRLGTAGAGKTISLRASVRHAEAGKGNPRHLHGVTDRPWRTSYATLECVRLRDYLILVDCPRVDQQSLFL